MKHISGFQLRSKLMRNVHIILAFVLIAGTGLTQAFADGGNSARGSRLAPYQQLIEEEKYQAAIDKLQAALKDAPNDADLLNLTAYSQRKLQRFDEALVNYQKALQIDPDHLGANEYLGELYLQLGQLDKALERLEVLDKECFFGCEEYDDLKEAIEKYRTGNQ
jgi:tetratricopeptide (TPR) repeat protein